MSGALRDEPSRERRDALSREAVALARRTGDDATLAYALDGRVVAISGPDTLDEMLSLGTELLELAERIGDPERVVHGHMHRLGPLLMRGRLEEAEAGIAAAERVAAQLRQPVHQWDVAGSKAMLTIAQGRLDDGERLAEAARALGERPQPDMAMPVYYAQSYTLADLRGDLEEVEEDMRSLVRERPARPVFRCILAHIHARTGQRAEAARALADLTADGCAAVPLDGEWLLAMSCLAESAGLVGEPAAAAVLYEQLARWADLVVVDQCEAMRGAVARDLGILATVTGRPEAERHFDDALAANARLGLRPWLARTQEDFARMLFARGGAEDRARAGELQAAARAGYDELGMAPVLTARPAVR